MPIEQCLNARTYLNIAARLSHSLQSCTPKGMMGTLSETVLPAMVTELSRNAWFKRHSGEITLMTWTPQSPDISLFGNRSNAASEEKSINLCQLCEELMSVWFALIPESGRSLAESMPRHVKYVIRAKGGSVLCWTGSVFFRLDYICIYLYIVWFYIFSVKLDILLEVGILSDMNQHSQDVSLNNLVLMCSYIYM